jgi:co-chaperonin GroES (HSP10)
VRLIELEEKSQGGIVLAATTKDRESMADIHGHLVAGGREGMARLEKEDIKLGDLVVFAKYSGIVYIGKDGARYRIMNAADVVARSEGIYDKSFKGRMPMGLQAAS